tara:strand:+ start:134 stop:607 length:474 start_codon:yes stop_codon:yes gene_type:complete
MEKNGNSAIWSPGELIYSSGSESTEAYLIKQGYVNLETSDGFKLNRLGIGEIFGETSLLLGTKRTVTAKACDQKVIANIIPKDYFKKLQQTDVILNAIIRKTQLRLMESNKKSNQLANEVSELLSSIKDHGHEEDELATRIKKLRKKVSEINAAASD